MSLVTIQNPFLTVTISSLGAELQSIRDAQGIERLWQGDLAFWTGRAPILFPVAGGLREDCYLLDGKRYSMPKHGFVRSLEWLVEEAAGDRATFLTQERHPGFPFAYELRARFALDGPALSVTYQVDNRDAQAFWYGAGAHEAYAIPEGVEQYELLFDQPERFDNYVLQGNLIGREPVTLLENTRVFPLKDEYFAVDALVFLTLQSRGVTLRSPLHSRTLRVDFPGHDVLMLWKKPEAGYLCIEPWLNGPDFVDHDLRIDHKPGCVRLAPGESKAHTHTLTLG